MSEEKVFLNQTVLAEPLYNQWYAWSHLIPPATSAMYTMNLHLKMMESFISAPQIHIAALKNPAMLGGPFINYDASRVVEVRELLEKTLREYAGVLSFARAIRDLNELLINEA